VEYDKRLAENLPKSFPGKNLEVINGDFLQYDLSEIPQPYVVAGNIPYYITSPIIEHILATNNLPERVVLLMQKEVAERIVSDKETVLSLKCKNRANVMLDAVVPREEFTPPPKVDSQVLIMEPHAPIVDDDTFKLISVAFSSPRKKLVHNLSSLKSKEEWLKIFDELNISPDARPADLHLNDYQKLWHVL
jgi:16S rRNA (adenine1518-N6/adenine1519-N6)-dimethyltransferase